MTAPWKRIPGNPAFHTIVAVLAAVAVVAVVVRTCTETDESSTTKVVVTVHHVGVYARLEAADLKLSTRKVDDTTAAAVTELGDATGHVALHAASKRRVLTRAAVGPKVGLHDLDGTVTASVRVSAGDPLSATVSPGSRVNVALMAKPRRVLIPCVLIIAVNTDDKQPTRLTVALRSEQVTDFLSARPKGQVLQSPPGFCTNAKFGESP